MTLFSVINSSFRLGLGRWKEFLFICLTLGVMLSLGSQWAEGFVGATEETTILSDPQRAQELVIKLQEAHLQPKEAMRLIRGDTAFLLSYPTLAPYATELPIFLRANFIALGGILILVVASFFVGILFKLLALHSASSVPRSLLELSRLAVPASLLQLLLIPFVLTWFLLELVLLSTGFSWIALGAGCLLFPFVYPAQSILLARRGGVIVSLRESILSVRRLYWIALLGMFLGLGYFLALNTLLVVLLEVSGAIFGLMTTESLIFSRLGTVVNNSLLLLPWAFYEFYVLEFSLKIWKGK